MFSLKEWLRQQFGGDRKNKSVFASEREAYEFCNKVYRETGGVTPELKRMYDYYQKSLDDTAEPELDDPRNNRSEKPVATFKVQLRGPGDRPVGRKVGVQRPLKRSA